MENTDWHLDSSGEYLVDENGDRIPAYVCMCFATNRYDCICGGWYTERRDMED
jgi:hypothetical protein